MSHMNLTQKKVSRPLPAIPTKKAPAPIANESAPLPRAQAHQSPQHGPQLSARPAQKVKRALPTPPAKRVARPLPVPPGKRLAPNEKLLSYLLPRKSIDTKICHISSIDTESIFACLLYAATGHENVNIKDLKTVCKAWSKVIMDPIKNKELLYTSQSYFIDLTQYTKQEAKAKIDTDLKNRTNIRHLHIHGQTSEPRIHASYPDNFFPEKFLGNSPLETLVLTGSDFDVSPLIAYDDVAFGGFQNTENLPSFQLIKNLKKLDIFSVTGGSRADSFFLETVIPNLFQLKELSIGHHKLHRLALASSRDLLYLKTIKVYGLKEVKIDNQLFWITVLDKIYTYTKNERLWTMVDGTLDYQSQLDLKVLNTGSDL